jgi:hypothetical protein
MAAACAIKDMETAGVWELRRLNPSGGKKVVSSVPIPSEARKVRRRYEGTNTAVPSVSSRWSQWSQWSPPLCTGSAPHPVQHLQLFSSRVVRSWHSSNARRKTETQP